MAYSIVHAPSLRSAGGGWLALAAVGLLIGTTMIIRMGKARYAPLTAIPGLAMVVITGWAGYLQIVDTYLP